jgi:hypothetical protein
VNSQSSKSPDVLQDLPLSSWKGLYFASCQLPVVTLLLHLPRNRCSAALPSTSHRLLDKEFVRKNSYQNFLQQPHSRSLLQTLTIRFRHGVPATEYWGVGDRNLFPESGMHLPPLVIVHSGTLESKLMPNSASNNQLLNPSMAWPAESTQLVLDRQK